MANKTITGGTVHKIPSDMRAALSADPKALAVWQDITPLARNEWICWTISVKKEETRTEHIQRALSQLKEGKRRPCCWIGCIHRTDKPVSRSVRAILERRSRSDS